MVLHGFVTNVLADGFVFDLKVYFSIDPTHLDLGLVPDQSL